MMAEYTEIKLVWKYDGNFYADVDGCDSWLLMMDGTEKVAQLRRYDDAFLQRVPILRRFAFLHLAQYRDLLPWRALDEGLDKEELFRLSDSGITTAEMDDVYEPAHAVRIKRNPDGSIERVSDWIEQGERWT